MTKRILEHTAQHRRTETDRDTAINGEGGACAKPTDKRRDGARHGEVQHSKTLQGYLQETEIGPIRTDRARQRETRETVQHMEEEIKNGYTVAIKQGLGQTVNTARRVHDLTEREEVTCRNIGEVVAAAVLQLQEEAACTCPKKPHGVEKPKLA